MDGEAGEKLYECRHGAASRPLHGGRGSRRRDVEATVLHQVVRENLATLRLQCAEAGGLPRCVERDFERYLECGVLARGFTRLACRLCGEERLVPFSCKSRGVCPSCNARRAHDTAIHLVEDVLPVAPYRQWTLSFPMRLRFLLARDSALMSEVLGVFVRALFCLQRKTARRLGVRKPFPGAVAFLQRFGSALHLTPHVHLLAPDGVFEQHGRDSPVRLCFLPPPEEAEVEELLRTVALRVVALMREEGKLEEAQPEEDALDFLRAEAVRSPRLPLALDESRPRRGRRCAFLEGFSLHANTWVHENDRPGLERICNYGSRGPLSLERLSLLPDGKVGYRMKRPAASGATELVLSPLAFLRRLAALVPPPGVHLVRFFGVLAPSARLRPLVVPRPSPVPPPAAQAPRTSRVPFAELLKRTFGEDIFTCDACGGPRRVVACVFSPSIAARILESLHLPSRPLPLARAQDPPQLHLYA